MKNQEIDRIWEDAAAEVKSRYPGHFDGDPWPGSSLTAKEIVEEAFKKYGVELPEEAMQGLINIFGPKPIEGDDSIEDSDR